MYNNRDPLKSGPSGPGLEDKFVDWAINKYRYLKFSETMSKLHADMSENWREIVVTAEACAKATEAHTYPKRKDMQKRAAAAFRERKKQRRQQREAR